MRPRLLAYALLFLPVLGCKRDKAPTGFSPSPIDRTVATHLGDSSRFIWDGPGAVQTGVSPGAIRRDLASVLRGIVRSVDGAVLPGVTVTVLGADKYGKTITRDKGEFDFVVNGGSLFTLKLEKAAQRGLPPVLLLMTRTGHAYPVGCLVQKPTPGKAATRCQHLYPPRAIPSGSP